MSSRASGQSSAAQWPETQPPPLNGSVWTSVSVFCCVMCSAVQCCVNLPAGVQKFTLTGGPGNRMSPRAVIRGGVLTFTAVDPADEGDYTCKALNTHGEHTARVSLFVQSTFSVHVCVNIYCMLWNLRCGDPHHLWGPRFIMGTN